MIARLQGRLAEKQPNRLIVDVNGVGYEVHVPLSTFCDVGDNGSDVLLHIHTHVRDDSLSLFGFKTLLELGLFDLLIAISGVGPRLALSVLSGIEPTALVRAIRTGEVERLTSIPGVGKKTAERIGLELKDKLVDFGEDQLESHEGSDSDHLKGDVLSALLNLGYHRQHAERVTETAIKESSGGFEQTLRHALQELAK